MTTTTVYTDADTGNNVYSPDQNLGTNPSVIVGTLDGVTFYDSYFRYPVSSIPANAVVSSVVWTCYTGGNTGVPNTVDIYAPSATWGELTLTGNNKPAPSTHLGSFTVGNGYGYKSASIPASIIASWRASNVGLMLRKNNEYGQSYAFWTKENTGPEGPSYITVVYTVPPSAPGAITEPNIGGEYDASITLNGSAATDADTATGSLQYEWSYFDTAWHVIGLTAAGVVSKVWDTSVLPARDDYTVRYRAFDGSNYGPYTALGGNFTIRHTSMVKAFDGTDFVEHPLSVFDGTDWQPTKLKQWNGSAWVDV